MLKIVSMLIMVCTHINYLYIHSHIHTYTHIYTIYIHLDIVVHPQSIVHSAIETQDTSVIAQLGLPDMRLPLLYSISWPARVPMQVRKSKSKSKSSLKLMFKDIFLSILLMSCFVWSGVLDC